jgi:uncharacterized protein
VDATLLDTALGPARLHRLPPTGRRRRPVGTLALGHGAGGGIGAVDLQAVAAAAAATGWQVLLVEQPWRVAGKRVAPAPARLDQAWLAVLEAVRSGPAGPAGGAGIPVTDLLVLGGRSAGARVACRTAVRLGAAGVCLLAFPLHPPGRPERSRAGELTGAGVPALVVQGRRDPFGGPDEVLAAVAAAGPGLDRPEVEVVPVDGDHGLAAGAAAAATAVSGWLARTAGR